MEFNDTPENRIGSSIRERAAMLAFASLAVIGASSSSDFISERIPAVSQQECTDPTSEQYAQVDSYLLDASTKSLMPEIIFYEYMAGQTTRFELRQSIADKHGVTVIDHLPYTWRLQEDLYKEHTSSLSITEYINAANDYFHQFGVELKIESEGDDGSNKAAYKLEELENSRAKNAVLSLMIAMSELPAELVQYSGIQKVRLLNLSEAEAAGMIEIGGEPGELFIDPLTNPADDTFFHELYHMIDERQCGRSDMYRDQGFMELNPGNIYDDDHDYLSQDGVILAVSDEIEAMHEAFKRKDHEAVVRLQEALLAEYEAVVTTSEYGFKNIVEDKAEIGGWLLDPNDAGTVLDEASPLLRSKATYLFARLYQDQPQVVRYLIEASAI